MIEFTQELIKKLNALKRQIFFEILEIVGRVFIIVDYDESVIIGKRGFLPEEKEHGLILVLNKKMNFTWDEKALTATLVFGNSPEKCYIPLDFITGVFSPDLRIQLTVPIFKKIEQKRDDSESTTEEKEGEKIIDIKKLRKK